VANPYTIVKNGIVTKLSTIFPRTFIYEWVLDSEKPISQMQRKAETAEIGSVFVVYQGSANTKKNSETGVQINAEETTISIFIVESQTAGNVSSENLDEKIWDVKKALTGLKFGSNSNLELNLRHTQIFGFATKNKTKLTGLVDFTFESLIFEDYEV